MNVSGDPTYTTDAVDRNFLGKKLEYSFKLGSYS